MTEDDCNDTDTPCKCLCDYLIVWVIVAMLITLLVNQFAIISRQEQIMDRITTQQK